MSTTGECDVGDFNCGTQYGYGASGTASDYLSLCRDCPLSEGVLTVGQCMGTVCAGLLNNGSCPSGTTLCTSRYASGVFPAAIDNGATTFLAAVNDAGGPLLFLWNNGTHAGDLFGYQSNTFPVVRWMNSVVGTNGLYDGTTTATFDDTNCVGIQGAHNHFAVVEHPSYLSGDTVSSNDYPAGLTVAALQAWCGVVGADCSSATSARRWLCVDSGQSIEATTTQSCRLRQAWVDNYLTYNNAQGQSTGFFGGTTALQVAPDCASWVSGLDPDSWCQRREAFTGCVIARSSSHTATMSVETQGDTFYGVVPGDGWTLLDTRDVANCSVVCASNVSCVAWHSGDTCSLYSASAWTFETGALTDTVGSVFPVTGGFLVPRTRAGPTIDMPTGSIGTTYEVTGMEVFVTTPNALTTAQAGEYSNVSCGGYFLYHGGIGVASTHRIDVASCDIVSNVSAYETTEHTFPLKPLIVRLVFSEPVWVLGSLSENWATGYGTGIFTEGTSGDTLIGRGRGLRGEIGRAHV